ncbi:hypothetical protein, conserved [Eimeria praecox]|uniref:Uncharacterized protein n=1 Tax=Eimeria praecox TaxID=51316 RepID=U6G5Q8_9EIME|nr:hypothetical protein, conserved [Eimeria praecox]
MPTAVREPTASRGVDESMAHNTAGCGESLSGVAAAANGSDAKSPAAASAARSSILQIQRQYPAAFAAVAAAAAATGQLQLLQDPLWLAAMGAVHAWKHNTNSEVPCNAEARYASAAAEEGEAVAAAIREAAKEAGGGDPVVRLQVAATLREAAALLHSIGDALAASSQKISGGKHESTIPGSQHSEGTQCLAAAAEQAANALELWHLRLMTLPISVSLVSLGSRGAAPWKPRPCVTFSGVAATPLLEHAAASNELLQLHQQVRLALRVLASLDVCSLENIQPLHIRCMHALQQAQQLALQLAPPAVATKAEETAAAEALTETAAEAATETAAADTAAAGSFAYTCDGAATPPPISASPESFGECLEHGWKGAASAAGDAALVAQSASSASGSSSVEFEVSG